MNATLSGVMSRQSESSVDPLGRYCAFTDRAETLGVLTAALIDGTEIEDETIVRTTESTSPVGALGLIRPIDRRLRPAAGVLLLSDRPGIGRARQRHPSPILHVAPSSPISNELTNIGSDMPRSGAGGSARDDSQELDRSACSVCHA